MSPPAALRLTFNAISKADGLFERLSLGLIEGPPDSLYDLALVLSEEDESVIGFSDLSQLLAAFSTAKHPHRNASSIRRSAAFICALPPSGANPCASQRSSVRMT